MQPYKSEVLGVAALVQPRPVRAISWRWFAVSVFIVINVLNFLDRQVLAALAPTLKNEFHLSNAMFGTLISAFALVYAVSTPFAGIFVDRVGLSRGAVTAVGEWSVASVLTGFASSFRGLFLCRAALGFGEAGALPLLSKANATYLPAAEWGLASAAGSMAITVGAVTAPLLVAAISPRYGWRFVFVVCGALGLPYATGQPKR
jgi:ACS family hexuronate transporter-like MFS transporter